MECGTVYFVKNKDENGFLDDTKFYNSVNKTIVFIWICVFVNSCINALRTKVYAEMVNIVNDKTKLLPKQIVYCNKFMNPSCLEL